MSPEQPEPAVTQRAFRCAEAARDRIDPQLGSAPQARRWLLIEHPGPWQVDALAGSGISAPVLDQLTRTARDQGARPLLIRRPGRTDRATQRSWAVTYENGSTRWGSWQSDPDLGDAVTALSAPTPPAGDSAGTDREPVLLACTHGLHDVCCALRGRPVAAALAQEWPAATWECSHVGGDRFAGNLVVLPDGVYYGNLDPAGAVATVRAHLAGTVPLDSLRGMTRVPPPAQVAIAEVHRRFGPFAARDVELTRLDHRAPGSWQVVLAVPRAELSGIEVTVTSTRRAPARLTCRAAAETPAADYHVVALQIG